VAEVVGRRGASASEEGVVRVWEGNVRVGAVVGVRSRRGGASGEESWGRGVDRVLLWVGGKGRGPGSAGGCQVVVYEENSNNKVDIVS
jgi:hypothetical protein